MLTLFGSSQRFCDGINRRNFLRIGALGIGASSLSLADIFRAESRASAAGGSTGSRHKAVINIFLGGGPPHQDMWDLKPDAPSEIRGEFKPISTAVPGLQIGETFPKIAARMNRFAVIRSIVGASGGHDAIQCMSGWRRESLRAMGGRPSIGAAVARLQGPVDPSVPPFVGLAGRTGHMPWADPGTAGFLGSPYSPFKPEGPGLADLKLSNMTFDALADRRRLLTKFDGIRRDLDTGDGIQRGRRRRDGTRPRRAYVQPIARRPRSFQRERKGPRALRRRQTLPVSRKDGVRCRTTHLLLARRLVEVGVRVVTLSYGRWDSHGQNFALVRDHGPKLDQGLRKASIDDLRSPRHA